MSYITQLSHYPLISDQISRPALRIILHELECVLKQTIDGAVVEFGCYSGTTSLFIRRLLDLSGESANRLFYVYDSFEGLPDKTRPDLSAAGAQFQAGALRTSKKQLIESFKKAHLQPPIIQKAWFKNLTDNQVPDSIAFAFLDGDFYESILDSLRLVWPRLAIGGTITIDDYQREALPGVSAAVRDYFGSVPSQLHYEHQIARIKKL